MQIIFLLSNIWKTKISVIDTQAPRDTRAIPAPTGLMQLEGLCRFFLIAEGDPITKTIEML
jgi:hypothetical protein